MEIILSIVIVVLQLLFVIMFISMLMSWIDMEQRFSFTRAIRGIVEPLIAPIRSVIPPIGVLDLSFFVAIILLQLMISLVKSVNLGGFSFLPF
ncbi:MAG: YggT family protein [Chloroflexota bacterium]|nr:YggT family protein [Chloroflexota bacterium]